MTGRYRFSIDNKHAIPNITVDENVIWSQQENMDGSTLCDTMNEGYETAEEDNATQYLSVLDTTNMSLDQLNITLTNPKLEIVEEPEEEEQTFLPETLIEEDQKVMVYAVEGSDELIGIQIAQDEDGNLQKYQFQLRQNEDGQLEAVPETIELLPMLEEDEVQEGHEQEVEDNAIDEQQLFFVHNNAQINQDDASEVTNEENLMYENMEEENHQIEETVDIKPSILALNVKQEVQDHQIEYVQEHEEYQSEHENYEHESQENVEEEHAIEYRNVLNPPEDQDEDTHISDAMTNQMELHFEQRKPETTEHFMQEAMEERIFSEELEQNKEDSINGEEIEENYQNGHHLNESDYEDYEIVDGVHITASDLVENDENVCGSNELALESLENSTNAINIRHTLKSNESNIKKDNKMYLYVVQHPEKENVDSMLDLPICRPKANPRSILKSSHGMLQGKNEIETVPYDERLGKRFSRGKEAMQARNFHNFINKTTIPQAPVRKDRLPRKQKIKPVERMDEEIVVQEVMVSSNGFQAIEGFNKENLAVTEYVELTDSDDDYDPKKSNKKKRRGRRKKVEITISDDEDSESHDSVIELDESDDEIEEEKRAEITSEDSGSVSTPSKRRRGRPPKNKPDSSEKLESPMKKMRLEETKPEIPCPKCDKSFPSQNSLKTHLQHHNLQTSWNDSKYKCEVCRVSFKNSILLKRHACTKTFNCTICKKKFGDATSLSVHKRTHAKEQLVKSTIVVPVSPKKPRASTAAPPKQFKSPPKMNKCKVCSRVCASLQALNIHMKSHKEFACGTCSKVFMSRIMLHSHVRENCVKSPVNPRRSMRIKSDSDAVLTTASGTSTLVKSASKLGLELNCDACSMRFVTYKALFTHRVAVHGVNTPDKSVLSKGKKMLFKEKAEHGGIPASKNLRRAFAHLKDQLKCSDNV